MRQGARAARARDPVSPRAPRDASAARNALARAALSDLHPLLPPPPRGHAHASRAPRARLSVQCDHGYQQGKDSQCSECTANFHLTRKGECDRCENEGVECPGGEHLPKPKPGYWADLTAACSEDEATVGDCLNQPNGESASVESVERPRERPRGSSVESVDPRARATRPLRLAPRPAL